VERRVVAVVISLRYALSRRPLMCSSQRPKTSRRAEAMVLHDALGPRPVSSPVPEEGGAAGRGEHEQGEEEHGRRRGGGGSRAEEEAGWRR
jgi:hypothetical protein